MGVPIEVWVDTIKKHPLKFRFEGLSGEYSYGGRRGWYTDVREAAVADEKFMNEWMEREREGAVEELEHELGLPPPKGDEDLPMVENYATFLRGKFWCNWDEPENINRAPARKVIEKLEPKEPIKRRYESSVDADSLRFEWSCEEARPEWAWEDIRENCLDMLLEKHPPTHVLDHASEEAVPVEDVVFICPGCRSQPIHKEQLDGAHYYCGLCGGESAPGEEDTLEQWAEDMSVKLWPFRATARQEEG